MDAGGDDVGVVGVDVCAPDGAAVGDVSAGGFFEVQTGDFYG